MAYNNLTSEILAELLKAQSAGQVMDILTRSGQECSAEDAEQIWQEIERHKVDYKEDVSLNELEAVSGGLDQGYVMRGCAASVGRNDGCHIFDTTFDLGSDGLTKGIRP